MQCTFIIILFQGCFVIEGVHIIRVLTWGVDMISKLTVHLIKKLWTKTQTPSAVYEVMVCELEKWFCLSYSEKNSTNTLIW